MGLFPFQQQGWQFLLSHPVALLADAMGLGKTVQVASAIRSLFASQVVRRVLIVCPMSLCSNWERELQRWASGIPLVRYEGGDRFGMLSGGAPILVGSYDTVVRDLARDTQDGKMFVDLGLDLLVLDEAQRIKSPETVRAKVLTAVLAPRRWAMTGTPMENHPRELASLLHFLFPNELAEEHDLDRDVPEILRLRDTTMLRRTKDEVLSDLPPKIVADIPVAMSPAQASEYEQVLMQCRALLTEPGQGLLGAVQQLRRSATVSSDGSSGKVDFLVDELQDLDIAKEKVVVFSSFPNLIFPLLVEQLSHLSPVAITGDMSSSAREEAHLRFTSEPSCHLMLASLGAAGVGYTWTAARLAYHTDLWWNPQVLKQAEDRLHRIGQHSPVLIKRLVSAGTIEEQIQEMLSTKEDIFDFVVEQDELQSPPVPRLRELLHRIASE